MSNRMTDEEMIRQYLSTQPNHCFETLYNRYVSKVYQRCLHMTKDSEKAQDFTHDIFIKAFDKIEGFQERSSFSTWLNTIAYNYCADQLRMAKRLHTTSIDADLEDSLGDSKEALFEEESFQRVRQAIANLSPDEQALLRLKYEEGMNIEQISALYQIKPSAVKMRLKRSREKIEQFYNRQHV